MLSGNLLKVNAQNIPYPFTYDDHYQIQTESGHATHSYSFDSLYNRTTKDGEAHQHNCLNQVISKGNDEFHYDLNGNLIKQSQCRQNH